MLEEFEVEAGHAPRGPRREGPSTAEQWPGVSGSSQSSTPDGRRGRVQSVPCTLRVTHRIIPQTCQRNVVSQRR